MSSGIEQALKARLRNIAKECRIDPAELWQNLVLERFLVRIARSPYAPNFILKGGVLLSKYLEIQRFTQDLDFSVQNLEMTRTKLEKIINALITLPINDGFSFDQLVVEPLFHPHMKHAGMRAKMMSHFGRTRFKVTLDFGYGDFVQPISKIFPLISSAKGPLFESEVEISCYPKEFIFAEKLEAAVYLGPKNSRMKDYHDLYLLVQDQNLPTERLERVIHSVFEHRQTELQLPLAFSSDEIKSLNQSWSAHIRGLSMGHSIPSRFSDTLEIINQWLRKHTPLCS